MAKVVRMLERAVHGPYPWWLWPSALVLLAALSIGASLTFYPVADDPTMVYIAGIPFGGECGLKTALGIPCAQCGMTRSWVYLVRGRVVEAFTYNTAGALLLLWIVVGGIIGAIRLVTGRERALRPPWWLLVTWTVFWAVVPYLGFWVFRIMGWNLLPEYV